MFTVVCDAIEYPKFYVWIESNAILYVKSIVHNYEYS